MGVKRSGYSVDIVGSRLGCPVGQAPPDGIRTGLLWWGRCAPAYFPILCTTTEILRCAQNDRVGTLRLSWGTECRPLSPD